MTKQKNNGFGIASLVLGILGLLLFMFGLVPSILSIIFAVKQRKTYPNGIATTGLILGIIGTVISGLFWLLVMLSILSA